MPDIEKVISKAPEDTVHNTHNISQHEDKG